MPVVAFGTTWIVLKHTWKSSAHKLPSARRVETHRQTRNSESYFQGLPHTTRFLRPNLNALSTGTHHRTHFWVARLTSHFRKRMMSRAASVGGFCSSCECRLLALRDILPSRTNSVAFGVNRTS